MYCFLKFSPTKKLTQKVPIFSKFYIPLHFSCSGKRRMLEVLYIFMFYRKTTLDCPTCHYEFSCCKSQSFAMNNLLLYNKILYFHFKHLLLFSLPLSPFYFLLLFTFLLHQAKFSGNLSLSQAVFLNVINPLNGRYQLLSHSYASGGANCTYQQARRCLSIGCMTLLFL